MEELMTVATFDDHDKALALCSRFDAAGIPCQVFDESMTQRIWWFTAPRAAMRVRVEKERAEEAIALLHSWDETDHVLAGSIRCPECGSSTIEYPQFSRKTMIPMFFALLSLVGVLPRQFFCESCNFTWDADPEEPKPTLDAMNWSVKRPTNFKPPS